MHVAVVMGTRPEAIKLAPVIHELGRQNVQTSVISTGQHREMLDQILEEFGVEPDVELSTMNTAQKLSDLTAVVVDGLGRALRRLEPDYVLVQGDTTTALCGALCGFYERVPVGHVEAGLRTGDRQSPFPEEANRSMTACIADLHFAPTEQARSNLLQQGVAAHDIVVTGNTVIDMLFRTVQRPRPGGVDATGSLPSPYVLVTIHRRENQGTALHDVCDALLALLAEHPQLSLWVPMHPSPDVRGVLVARLSAHARALLTEPRGYTNFVAAMHGAALVLTDSGGVQEECAALGKPVLVLRADTERPEAVDAGVALLVGTGSSRIVTVASELLRDPERHRDMARPTTAFGDGRAAGRILDAIAAARRPSVVSG